MYIDSHIASIDHDTYVHGAGDELTANIAHPPSSSTLRAWRCCSAARRPRRSLCWVRARICAAVAAIACSGPTRVGHGCCRAHPEPSDARRQADLNARRAWHRDLSFHGQDVPSPCSPRQTRALSHKKHRRGLFPGVRARLLPRNSAQASTTVSLRAASASDALTIAYHPNYCTAAETCEGPKACCAADANSARSRPGVHPGGRGTAYRQIGKNLVKRLSAAPGPGSCGSPRASRARSTCASRSSRRSRLSQVTPMHCPATASMTRSFEMSSRRAPSSITTIGRRPASGVDSGTIGVRVVARRFRNRLLLCSALPGEPRSSRVCSIDPLLVRDIHAIPFAKASVSAVISMAHSLGLEVVAKAPLRRTDHGLVEIGCERRCRVSPLRPAMPARVRRALRPSARSSPAV